MAAPEKLLPPRASVGNTETTMTLYLSPSLSLPASVFIPIRTHAHIYSEFCFFPNENNDIPGQRFSVLARSSLKASGGKLHL